MLFSDPDFMTWKKEMPLNALNGILLLRCAKFYYYFTAMSIIVVLNADFNLGKIVRVGKKGILAN